MPLFRPGLLALLLCASMHAGGVQVVSNPNTQTSTLTLSHLRSIFSMRITQWPNGDPIRVFVLGDKDPLHTDFSKQVLGIFPHQLRRAWNRQIYSGTGQAPIRVESEEEMQTQIESTPGAIGYLPEDQIDENVRTITIE